MSLYIHFGVFHTLYIVAVIQKSCRRPFLMDIFSSLNSTTAHFLQIYDSITTCLVAVQCWPCRSRAWCDLCCYLCMLACIRRVFYPTLCAYSCCVLYLARNPPYNYVLFPYFIESKHQVTYVIWKSCKLTKYFIYDKNVTKWCTISKQKSFLALWQSYKQPFSDIDVCRTCC